MTHKRVAPRPSAKPTFRIMRIYRVSRYVESITEPKKWMIAGTNYYSTKRKANNRIDNEIARDRDNARSVKDLHDINSRIVTLYMEAINVQYVMSAIEVE